jgi:hypothetical protein
LGSISMRLARKLFVIRIYIPVFVSPCTMQDYNQRQLGFAVPHFQC